MTLESMERLRGLPIADEIEREIAEKYMELPTDADGVPVRIGDKMTNINKPSDEYTVTSITESGCRVYGDCAFIKTSQLRHVKPDKLKERVADFGETVARQGHQWGLVSQEHIDALCAEIREMAGKGEL